MTRGRPTLVWTDEMVRELVKLRAMNLPFWEIAERVGVGYAAAVLKGRELGIAERRNRGPRSGPQMLTVGRRHA